METALKKLFFRYLAFGVAEDAIDWKSHDDRYHNGHFNSATMTCKTRDAFEVGDLSDVLKAENEEAENELLREWYHALVAPKNIKEKFSSLLTRLTDSDIPTIDKTVIPGTATRKQIANIGKMAVLRSPSAKESNGQVDFTLRDGTTFVVSTPGLMHGLRPYSAKTLNDMRAQQRYNAYIMPCLDEVFEHAEYLRSQGRKVDGERELCDVYVSARKDGKDIIPVIIKLSKKRTDANRGVVAEILVLKCINANRQGHADVLDSGIAPPCDLAASTVSIISKSYDPVNGGASLDGRTGFDQSPAPSFNPRSFARYLATS